MKRVRNTILRELSVVKRDFMRVSTRWIVLGITIRLRAFSMRLSYLVTWIRKMMIQRYVLLILRLVQEFLLLVL